MVDKFKSIADFKDLEFNYGSTAYHNLLEFDSRDLKTKFLLDPIIRQDNLSSSGYKVSVRNSGSFVVLMKSSIDEKYFQTGEYSKYELYLKPVKTIIDEIKDRLNCDANYVINSWRETEVINLFDMNADGIMVEFSIDKF